MLRTPRILDSLASRSRHTPRLRKVINGGIRSADRQARRPRIGRWCGAAEHPEQHEQRAVGAEETVVVEIGGVEAFRRWADAVDEHDEETIAGPVVFDLSGLDVDYFPTKSGTETIGSLAGTVDEGYRPQESMPAPEGQTYTMEDFKREAGQQRGGNEPKET